MLEAHLAKIEVSRTTKTMLKKLEYTCICGSILAQMIVWIR